MKRILWCATALVALASAARAADAPPGEPLDCMKPYKMKEFPVVAWCFHKYEGNDYTEQYAKDLAAANFNAVVETGYMLDACQKAGLKVFYYMQTEDTLTEAMVWGERRTHPKIIAWPKVEDMKRVHAKHGQHPALAGYVIQSNYGAQLPGYTAEVAKWLEGEKTGLLPWVCYCKDPQAHAKAGLAVLTIECFGRKIHNAFGFDNKGWAHDKRNGYCAHLEQGRRIANKFDMALWPMYSAITATKGRGEGPVGNLHGESEIRFQILAPVAYGAQGVVCFVYSTDRDVWKIEGGPTYRAAKETNGYLASVAGPRVLGHRSIGVYQSAPDTPVRNARTSEGAIAPGAGKLIEKMDKGVMAGVLVTEKDFKAGKEIPAYVMLIDARTEILASEKQVKERTLQVTFGPQVQAVEILGAKGEPDVRPSTREVSLTLRPGDGRLLRIVPAAK